MANAKFREQAERLLAPAEVAINGSEPWDIQVHDERLFARVFAEGTLGFGESTWMAGGTPSSWTRRGAHPGSAQRYL